LPSSLHLAVRKLIAMDRDELVHFLKEVQGNLQNTLLAVDERLTSLNAVSNSERRDKMVTFKASEDSSPHCAVTVSDTQPPLPPPLQPPPPLLPPPPLARHSTIYTDAPHLNQDAVHDHQDDRHFSLDFHVSSVIPGAISSLFHHDHTPHHVAPEDTEDPTVVKESPPSESSLDTPAGFDVLFKYDLQDRQEKKLTERLEEIQKAMEVPERQWRKQLRVENVRGEAVEIGQELNYTVEDDYPLTVMWKWLDASDFGSHITKRERARWLVARARFYFIGLTDNEHLRALLLRLRSRLRIISEQAESMYGDMLEDGDELDDTGEHGAEADERLAVKRRVTMGTEADKANCADTLRRFESLLKHEFTHLTHYERQKNKKGLTVRTDEFFMMAGCPFDAFVEIYIRDRDIAFRASEHKRRETLNLLLRATNMVDILCGYLQNKIDANDQLFFKLFLLVVNVVTCAAQFAYNDHIKDKPDWMKQIQKIYERIMLLKQ